MWTPLVFLAFLLFAPAFSGALCDDKLCKLSFLLLIVAVVMSTIGPIGRDMLPKPKGASGHPGLLSSLLTVGGIACAAAYVLI